MGAASFRLELPAELARLHPVFHVSLLKKAVGEVHSREPVFRADSAVPEFEV